MTRSSRPARPLLTWLAAAAALAAPSLGRASPATDPLVHPATYHLSYESTADVDLSALMSAGQSGTKASQGHAITSALTGELLLHRVDGSDGRSQLFVRGNGIDARLLIDGSDQPAETHELVSLLEGGFLIDLLPDGLVAGVRLDGGIGRTAQSVARTLAAALQMSHGHPADARSWSAVESDRAGTYLANYRRMKPRRAGEVAILKTKVRYLDTNAPDFSFIPRRTTLTSTITPHLESWAQFDAKTGQLLGLDAVESQTAEVRGVSVAKATSRLQLIFESGDPDSLPAPYSKRVAQLAAAPLQPLLVVPDTHAIERRAQAAQLGDLTTADILARLETDPDEMYLKIKALATVRPAECTALAAALAAAPAGSAKFSVLVRALAALGSPEAQAALLSGFEAHRGEADAEARLIGAIASAPEPTPESEKLVRDAAARAPAAAGSTALLALGTMAHNLYRSAPQRANDLVGLIGARLATEPDPAARSILLEALGNAGTPAAQALARSFATDGTAQVRRAAMHALRFAGSAEAEAVLARALIHDGDPMVRAAAAFALSFHRAGPSIIRAELAAAKTDPDEAVRSAALANLGKVERPSPEIRRAVADSAAHDKSETVRDRAARILQTLNK